VWSSFFLCEVDTFAVSGREMQNSATEVVVLMMWFEMRRVREEKQKNRA
jgi:hypothetical protein